MLTRWKHIYIGCPAGRFTGGPTLAHQLCAKLRENGIDARMFYYNWKKMKNPVHEQYRKLAIPYASEIVDETMSLVIAPETNVNLLKNIRKAKRVIWWMSVDNYFDKFLRSRRNLFLHFGGLTSQKIDDNRLVHFVQSEYARKFLKNRGIPEKRIIWLSDYLDKVFIEESNTFKVNKENIILYNPRKGLRFTKKIISAAPGLSWKALDGLTPMEIRDYYRRSKVYIDFGNHPGKDRMPREAAICGCCVITGRRGSAENNIDIPIDPKYKFEEKDENIPEIIETIHRVLEKYEEAREDFKEYRAVINAEEEKFDNSVKLILSMLEPEMSNGDSPE